MRGIVAFLGATALLWAASADAKDRPAAKPKPAAAPAPVASAVVVRRTASLDTAFATILAHAKDLGPRAGVGVVLEPSPAVRDSAKTISAALAALSGVKGRPTSWQVATLGGAWSQPVADPASLPSRLADALAHRGKSSPNTLGLLRSNAKRASGDGGLLLYVAHGHFEDDVDLEGFVAELLKAKRTLCVIGPEAAFEWTWGDVVGDLLDWTYKRGRFETGVPGVGNSPFGPEVPTAPWHGGDTAYPLAPLDFAQGLRWNREMRPDAVGSRRLLDGSGPHPSYEGEFVKDSLTVPSSFGPYGLMRAAGASGGMYVLWSWTRAGNVDSIRYDYARCNVYPPDLRARSEILADIPARPLSKGLLALWADLVSGDRALVSNTPPWRDGQPGPIAGTLGELYLVGILDSVARRDEDVSRARAALPRIAAAITRLDLVLREVGDPKDDVDRRLRADACLLRHALETASFHVREFAAVASSIDPSAWKGKGAAKPPYLRETDWIHAADDDEPVAPTDAVPHEIDAAKALLESRKAFLERYRGTPFGALVARNEVVTFTVEAWDYKPSSGGVPLPKGSGSSSGKTPPPTGGSSGTPGPTTGK